MLTAKNVVLKKKFREEKNLFDKDCNACNTYSREKNTGGVGGEGEMFGLGISVVSN